jgi:hypothetical protein
VSVNVPKNANTEEVYKVLVNKVGLSSESSPFFALFEIVEYNFGKLLMFSSYVRVRMLVAG